MGTTWLVMFLNGVVTIRKVPYNWEHGEVAQITGSLVWWAVAVYVKKYIYWRDCSRAAIGET